MQRTFVLVTSCVFAGGFIALLMAGSVASAASFLLGVVGTAIFLAGTWMVVLLTGAASAQTRRVSNAQVVVGVALLLLKLPLIYIGWIIAERLGPSGPACFLAGLALVYCAVIWRAVLAVRE